MAFILEKTWNGYKILTDIGDERTKDFFLITNPLGLFSIVAVYLYFCLSLGPKLMQNRKPFKLKEVLIVYNACQVLYSIYIVYLGTFAYINNYNYFCQPLDNSNDPVALKIADACWFYFFAKITELLDTVFFVLKKKDSHISFLHIYHHASMPIYSWIAVKYFPCGHGLLMGWLNSMVHIVMYFYYFLAGFGPQYQKYLWWKRHITILQLVQFGLIIVHNVIPLFNDCTYPKIVNFMLIFNSILFVYLFGKFYVNTYLKNNKVREVKTAVNGSTNKSNGYDSTNGRLNNKTKISNGHSKVH